MIMPNGKNVNENICVYDNNEKRGNDKVDSDLAMVDLVDTEFPAVVGGTRKHKDGRKIEGEMPVKFIRYHFHDHSASEKLSPLGNDDGFSSGRDVDNPASDEDIEDLKQ